MQGISQLGMGAITGLPPRMGHTASLPGGPISPMEQKRVPFRDLMLGAVQEVNQMQQDADIAVETMMTGGDIGTAEVLTAVQKADIAFKLMMQIRNKLVSAYQEIQNIRV
jgi:flagellar hook-basal body complex protein FliE